MTNDEWRRKLSFRSWHRGTREMDILMGRFADFILPSLDAAGLSSYDRFLEENDPDLYDFYCGRGEIYSFDIEVSRDILQQFKNFSPL